MRVKGERAMSWMLSKQRMEKIVAEVTHQSLFTPPPPQYTSRRHFRDVGGKPRPKQR